MPNRPVRLFTIGFTGKTAKQFFTSLEQAGVRRLVDTRLNNVSQLAGFAKRKDLEYFLKAIANIEYEHDTELAPTADMLDAYKKKKIDWAEYEKRFNELLEKRTPELHHEPVDFDGACLLCSEPTPHHCHRRLVAERLKKTWPEMQIVDL